MDRTWVVVANATKSRVLSPRGKRRHLSELSSMENPRGRLHVRDLVTDGRGYVRPMVGALTTYQSHQDPKARVIENFARRIAAHIELSRKTNAFQTLTLVAPPAFLGMLRKELSSATRQCMNGGLNLDLVNETPQMIERHLVR